MAEDREDEESEPGVTQDILGFDLKRSLSAYSRRVKIRLASKPTIDLISQRERLRGDADPRALYIRAMISMVLAEREEENPSG